MNLSLSKFIAFAYGSITRKLYLHTAIVAVFLLIVISITIWAGNTLTMITAIARFERTHTVSRVEAMVAFFEYHDHKKPEELEPFRAKMAITQSYNKVFSRLLDMRKDTSDADFVRILENTFSETDHRTAVIIVNRIKVLYWHPVLKDLVADAVGANAAGEKLKAQVAQILATSNESEQAAIFTEINKTRKEFISYETSFSKSCSVLANQISSYVNYITIFLLIISVGFTGLLTYLIARTVIQEAARYTSDLEKEIRERKRAEELLNLFKESVTNSTDAIGMSSPEGKHIYQNKAFDNLFGEIGENPPDVYVDENVAGEVFKTILAGVRWSGEVEMYAKDKSVRNILLRAYAIKEADGRITGVVGIHTDITERKQADAMLRDNEEKYRLLVNNLSSGVVAHASDSSVIFSNPMASTLLGLTNDQMRGKDAMDPVWNFLQENGMSLPLAEYPVNRVLSSGEPIANQVLGIRRPDLTEPVWVQCNAYPVTTADGALLQVVVTFSDISERKRDKEIIEKRLVSLTQPLDSGSISFEELFSRNELQNIQDAFAEATGVASIITAPDGIPITRPSNFCRLCNDIIRKSEKGLANCIKSDSVLGKCNPSGPIVQPCMSGGLWDGGASITVGGKHVANWLIGQVRNETQDNEKMLAYADEIGVDRELFRSALAEVPTMSKERFDKVALALYLLANELSLKAYQNIQQARFITERKEYEKDLQQKNAELERFTYTVSHDLKSPIITIKGFTGSLEKDLAKGNYERMAGDLKRVSDAADKMNDLLRDLLELSTIGRIIKEPETVDMNLLVTDVLAQLAGILKNSNLTVAVQPNLPEVMCDKRRMAEVLQNLLENAINYMGDQPAPCIQLGMREDNDVKVFFVKDNGIGIDEKYHNIIFGLFNKLDANSEGTGIGLALVKRIVEVHGGRVWVESDGVGKGCRFCFTIKEAKV